MDWFSADFHLGHANIIKHCKRPFSSIEEMDRILLENINKLVRPNDRFFIIGDFAWWGCSPEQLKAYRDAINCKNVYLIIGNHDEPKLKHLKPLFLKVEHILEIKVQTPENPKQRITLCHYAMRVWNQSHRKSFLCFGHSHHNLPDDPKSLSIDVGVDGKNYNYSPINLETICNLMSKKQWEDPFDKWEKEGTLYRSDSRNTPEHD